MSQTDEFNKFRNSEWDYFKSNFADFDKHWRDITAQLKPEFVTYLKSFLQKKQLIFTKDQKFSIELVIDTNVLFAEIYSIMKGKPSFLRNAISNPFLKLYAPPEILEEVARAIKKKLPKRLDKNRAREIAQEILSKVQVLKARRLQAWLKASALIGKRDSTDIPFLALAFSVETHGIVSRDPDFAEQEEVKIWQLGETGRMVSNLTKNSFAFFFTCSSVLVQRESDKTGV